MRLAVEVDGAGKLRTRDAFEAFFERSIAWPPPAGRSYASPGLRSSAVPPTWPASSANVWGVWPTRSVGDRPQTGSGTNRSTWCAAEPLQTCTLDAGASWSGSWRRLEAMVVVIVVVAVTLMSA